MTFLELEKKCKKRKFFKFFKAVVFLFLVVFTVSVYFYKKFHYKNSAVTTNKTEKKKKLAVKQINIRQKKEEKNLSAEKKLSKNNEKLCLIIDLNVSELQKKKIEKQQKQVQKFNKILPEKKKSAFIITAKALPSYKTCMALAEKYYKEGDYKEALKWAKNANVQNNKKPESWMLSAKSLYKLGKKEEALKVLKIYYNYRKDEKIKKLMGELNESN